MLQSMNTGHDGSLSTVHANTPRDALGRLETMVMMAGYEIPMRAVRQQISAALDMVIQIERMEDGHRRITSITEVQRMEVDVITLQELFTYKVEQVTGRQGRRRQPRLDRASADLPRQVREARHPASGRSLPGVVAAPRPGGRQPVKILPGSGSSRLRESIWVGAAYGAAAPTLIETGGTVYPQRSYILTLPTPKALTSSDVKVTENGEAVTGVTVAGHGGRRARRRSCWRSTRRPACRGGRSPTRSTLPALLRLR